MEDTEELYQKLKDFCKINKQFAVIFKKSQSKQPPSDSEQVASLLDYIAKEIIILPQWFSSVLKTFPKEIPNILFQAVFFTKDFPFTQQRHIVNCILLSQIVKERPDLKSYALKYFEKYPSPFEEDINTPIKAKRSRLLENIFVRDVDIVQACYFLLRSDPKFYWHNWKWSVFMKKYSSNDDYEVAWLYCQIMGIILGRNETDLNALIAQKIPEDIKIKLTIEFNKNSGFIGQSQESSPLNQQFLAPRKTKDLAEVVSISGVYIPALKGPKKALLVAVPSTYNNLRKIAIGLSSSKALCLQGPVGAGKTGLVEHLAACTGRKLGDTFVKVQLGDQTDSKMLLGTYRCTDTPGEFIWQPGVLTQAVIQGSWLLLEDIDLASMDIASVLASLLENNALTVPGYRDLVPITPGFQLIVTQRLITTMSGNHKRHSNAMHLLEKQLLQITIDPLTSAELIQILHVKYPQFDTISNKLVSVFELFNTNKNESSLIRKSGRLISTRDFFKWCSRAAIDFNVKSQESALKILQDAIDVFCCAFSNNTEALELAKEISTHLGIINQKAEYFFNNYKPMPKLTSNQLIAGRISLQREHSAYSKQAKFCFTRPAAILLERIMCCVNLKEPVLLVGETGTGKTSSVQYLAHTLGKRLIVINMNQQSDSADLLGGFKPVDLKIILNPIKKDFEVVFRDYFDVESNKEFLNKIAFAYNKGKFVQLVSFMQKSVQAALRRLSNVLENPKDVEKKQKDEIFFQRWQIVGDKLRKVEVQLKQANALYFAFIEGSLVKAIQGGSWVLLDEINLANAETLECLSGLLEDTAGSLCLLERGDKKPVQRHPNFTLFACMNPATNVGKKDLPVGLRNRFTEFYVDELIEKNDLMLLVNSYLDAMNLKEEEVAKIVDFYTNIRKEMQMSLCDGIGHKPHFSLRSLCRALTIAGKNPCGNFKRSLYEAFCLSFLTQLDSQSYQIVQKLIVKYLIGVAKLKAIIQQPIPKPKERGSSFLEFEGYWIKQGSLESLPPDDYILTDSVRRNLKDLARVVSIGKLPVLLQGDTSVGKTSLIIYLAKSSGNKCVRINNHEHTDLQEYIGSYVADTTGKLVFREGVLVEAMRKGHWIILDELNLAPTDVLEALNRVLDDNRELFIPETQETVKADPNFMLFATQNPPGVYGGRKMLSRAFRNRFVELHFNEIPPSELEFILHQRCAMPPSYAKKMISVMGELQVRRRGSAAFAGKQGFITLRDLFRWGERYRLAANSDEYYDWSQHLADEGYLVLAGKVRKDDEKKEIMEVLKKNWLKEVRLENLFSLQENTSTVTRHILEKLENNSARYPNIVWTFNMRKLAVLVAKALEFKEPVLLVGETGGGKTTICQLLAENNGQELVSVNCHMHTESSDFLGGLRPVRDHSENSNSLFEWVDGTLLQAMLKGSVFLADEISLADDSVLERLNSLLEPERTLLLAEKGIDLNNPNNSETVVANSEFVFIGTMNPGGDFGKKELSPALRNRFSEIWCDSCTDREDLILIINKNLHVNTECNFGEKMMDFIEWFKKSEIGKRYTISIRDILTWVNFVNACSENITTNEAYINGAYLVFLDSLGSGITSTESTQSLRTFKTDCEKFLKTQIGTNIPDFRAKSDKIICTDSQFGIKPFFIPTGQEAYAAESFSFDAPTTVLNTVNLLRGMQLNKAILLEGSPGVGKSTLVTALAKKSRHKIFRVNLSDQTDISDLFGADLPVEGGTGGQFSWRDGPLLQALKEGSWILLDELNLASQSVLEGLNACLDHRGEIFIPELGKTFHVKPGTRFFACQNPMKQGGSRRGLPKSFLNRFIQVYACPFTPQDMEAILGNQFNNLPREMITKMIEFNYRLASGLNQHQFGHKGSPWECNLRDLTRWCQAILYHFENASENKVLSPESTVQLIYIDRMRTIADKNKVEDIFKDIFGCDLKGSKPVGYINKENVLFGDVAVKRGQDQLNDHVLKQDNGHLLLRGQLGTLRSLAYCVNQNWMAIVVGNSGVGKSSVVKTLANLAGKTLKTLPVTSAMDTTDILGGFEQTNYSRHLEEIAKEAEAQTLATVQVLLLEEKSNKAAQLLEYWEEYLSISESSTETLEEEVNLFSRRLTKLEGLLRELYLKCSSNNDANKILQLMEKCSKLFEAVNRDKSLSAGGRFEWVNSILVKCLQEGSWLLVDNVNLCSAAVLDRLNALLEPNGVLTISEKGVDENGKMFEVKPHKDFRIFLTMDPKNGEISRAMRNRGVEIYMPNETETQYTNQFDIKSLIDFEGLSNPKHINALLKVHDFISSVILSDKPGNMDLIQCSSLIAQQIRHGINIYEAFYNTCIEVYYKTRNSSEFNCNNILEVIKEEINRSLSESDGDDFYNVNVTMNTKDLVRWSNFEKVKHQSALYDLAGKKFNENVQQAKGQTSTTNILPNLVKYSSKTHKSIKAKDLTIWSDLESVKQQYEFFDNINFYTLANLLSISYSLSTNDDIDYRTAYLKSIITVPEWQNVLERFHKTIKFFDNKTPHLPYDGNWINDDLTNKSVSLALQLEIYKLKELYELKYSSQKSLHHYLLAIKKKEVSDIFNSPICSNFINLRAEHIIFMKQLAVTFAQLNYFDSADVFVKTLELLSWRQALHSFLTSVRVPDGGLKSPKLLESKLDTLALYYKWFYKYSVEDVAKLLDAKVPEKLNSIVCHINEKIQEQFSKNYKIAKNYKKLNDVPEFFTSERQLTALDLLESYNLYDYESKNETTKILAYFKSSGDYRNLLVQLKDALYSEIELNNLEELKPFEVNSAEENCFLNVQEKEILPLVDVLTQTLLLQVIMAIQSGDNFELDSLTNNYLVPIELNGILSRYKRTGDRKLLHEIKRHFYSTAANSPSVKPIEFFEDVDTLTLSVAGAGPVILRTLTKLLVHLDGESVSLRNFRAVQSQRKFMSRLLWNNMHAMASEKFDFLTIQSQILKENVKLFMDRLQKSLQIDITDLSTHLLEDRNLKKIIGRIQSRYEEMTNNFSNLKSNDQLISHIADLHINLAFAELYINSFLPQIDPLAKKAMKKNHIASIISMFEQMRQSFDMQSSLFSNEGKCRHPYYVAIEGIIKDLRGKMKKYGESANIGVNSYAYSYVLQQLKHASSSVLKTTILDDIENCTDVLIPKLHSDNTTNAPATEIKYLLKKLQSNFLSFQRISQDWRQYCGSYPDIVEPLLSNISQFLYGFKLKLFWIKREYSKYECRMRLGADGNLENDLLRFAAFPSLDATFFSLDRVADYYMYKQGNYFNYLLDGEQFRHVDKEKEQVRLQKCAIQECFNQCVVNGRNSRVVDGPLFKKFNYLVEQFVALWNMQQENKEMEKSEAESLYKTRTKCDDKTEEEQIDDELKELFPNHHVLDFSDLQEKSLSDSTADESTSTKPITELITEEDLMSVIDLHSKLFKNFVRTEWLSPEPSKNVQADFLSPLMENYKIVRRIMDTNGQYFQYTLDTKLSGSLAVLLEVSRRYGTVSEFGSDSPSKMSNKDFYKDSDVEEVKTCYHVLDKLKLKVNELLLEWPDQPTLNTIITVIDRILTFDIKSPIARYLTGFDILLAKCHEWEQVAHSGVSLLNDTPEVIAQIITWRKLELARWKDLLNCTFNEMTKPLSKWWMYMYNLSNQYLKDKQITESELVDTLQRLITKSTLVEFHGRLDIILEFHCYAITQLKTRESEAFVNILWNVYNYYNQFATIVSNKLRDLRAPIERKLKDYVKIVKWKDVNYWSVKDTVDKSYKALHKFVREYKDVLLQPVAPFLTNPSSDTAMESVGIWDRPQRQNPKAYHYTLDADSYLVKASVKDSLYLSKARKICKETILGTEYPDLVKTLDTFVTDVIETSEHMRKLEVDTTLPKEKQKSQAKNILHQKHRTLADLFQTLSKMGVSYKTGIADSKLKKPTEEYTVKPVDLSACYSYLGFNRMDGKILTIWDSCELYYYRCLIRYDVLTTALVTPAQDLGVQNIDRCRGFAAHLLTFCQNQKNCLINATRSHYALRSYAKQIRDSYEHLDFLSAKTLMNIKNLLNSLTVVISQVQLILNSCPDEQSLVDEQLFEIPLLDPNGEKFNSKGDENWKKAQKSISNINSSVTKTLHTIQKFESSNPFTERLRVDVNFVPFAQKDLVNVELQKISENLDGLKEIFEPIPITESLDWLASSIRNILQENQEGVSQNASSNEFESLIDSFTKSLLIIFQNLYKKYKEDYLLKDDSEAEKVDLKDNHLKVLITKSLSSDFNLLDLDKILITVEKVVKAVLGGSAYVSDEMKITLSQCLPLFDQVLQLAEYFITQQVAAYRTTCKLTSILLNIFIDLATKGFCVPPEFSDEIDKEGMSKPTDGMGLGEGQGERDVSDKIESEDQLDDAQPAGQEKDDKEDPDCNEEDKGIEMSEDFDSKLQDKKPTGEDEEDQQSDNSDAEEQMGETDKGADQLDQEIWGDDKDEENDDNEDAEQKEEDGKGGEKEGEDQLEAKDENDSKQKNKNQDETQNPEADEDSEKNKKEINEMKEPEYNEDQVDPYHGNQPELPEPDPMDLPDDLQLDEGEENDGEQPEENPFDIDEMKDQQIPDDDKPEPNENQNDQHDEEKEFSSDDEDITKTDQNEKVEDNEADPEEDKEKSEQEKIEEPKKSQEGEEETEEPVDNEENALDQKPSGQDNIEAMEVDEAEATDNTQATQSDNLKSDQPMDEILQEDKPDKEGMGQSQMEESESGHSVQSAAPQEARSSKSEQEKEERKKEKIGESNLKRSAGDVNQSVEKKLKTVNAKDDQPEKDGTGEEEKSDMYQHIQEAKDDKNMQVFDAATKEQAEEQSKEAAHKEDEEIQDEEAESAKDLPEEKEEVMEVDVSDTQTEKPMKTDRDGEKPKNKKHSDDDAIDGTQDVEIEGDIVKTTTVPRGGESFHHTQYHLLQETNPEKLAQEEINLLRDEVTQELSTWKSTPNSIEAEQTWQKISSVTASLAQDLSEQLRLVLEPTQASHLKGDFRTGRRINMRKVIPYIASQFRKDKIWLRRTKPSKREYQIVLAIDDSSSMADNQSKELAFESVALISKALSLLESGQLAVVSFGETTKLHHKLSEPFNDRSGVQLLQNFQFDQQKTHIGKLVDFVTEMFNQSNIHTSLPNAKLLLIVSDGRGVFSEGKTYVTQALRRAKLENIFIVFIIVDSPDNRDSILDIKSTMFDKKGDVEILNYMDEFPFSFYLILRDIHSLPGVLSDALMQWFEMVTSQQ